MTWTKIYNKIYKLDINTDFRPISKIRDCDIKDVWGYLICFAETKGIEINIVMIDNVVEGWVGREMQGFSKVEQAMLWCAEEFFKVAK